MRGVIRRDEGHATDARHVRRVRAEAGGAAEVLDNRTELHLAGREDRGADVLQRDLAHVDHAGLHLVGAHPVVGHEKQRQALEAVLPERLQELCAVQDAAEEEVTTEERVPYHAHLAEGRHLSFKDFPRDGVVAPRELVEHSLRLVDDAGACRVPLALLHRKCGLAQGVEHVGMDCGDVDVVGRVIPVRRLLGGPMPVVVQVHIRESACQKSVKGAAIRHHLADPDRRHAAGEGGVVELIVVVELANAINDIRLILLVHEHVHPLLRLFEEAARPANPGEQHPLDDQVHEE
mmetsp:Transcript_122531/g.381429  ORF Transcript_122531/g.381429 Transcript_122531/m.381429 type:complete len:291 (-) Transcript_122531:257-1129(-)